LRGRSPSRCCDFANGKATQSFGDDPLRRVRPVGRIFPGTGQATVGKERERNQFGVEPRERDRTGSPKLGASAMIHYGALVPWGAFSLAQVRRQRLRSGSNLASSRVKDRTGSPKLRASALRRVYHRGGIFPDTGLARDTRCFDRGQSSDRARLAFGDDAAALGSPMGPRVSPTPLPCRGFTLLWRGPLPWLWPMSGP
jgi:hypothetical protein